MLRPAPVDQLGQRGIEPRELDIRRKHHLHTPAPERPLTGLVTGAVHAQDEEPSVREVLGGGAVQPPQLGGDHCHTRDSGSCRAQQLRQVRAPPHDVDGPALTQPGGEPRVALPADGGQEREAQEPDPGAGTRVTFAPWATLKITAPTWSAGTTACTAVRPTPIPTPVPVVGVRATTALLRRGSGSRYRSEERRVGKDGGLGWWRGHEGQTRGALGAPDLSQPMVT